MLTLCGGGWGAFSSYSAWLPGLPPKGGDVVGLTLIVEENYEGNKSTWPQLKPGGFSSAIWPLPPVEGVREPLLPEPL